MLSDDSVNNAQIDAERLIKRLSVQIEASGTKLEVRRIRHDLRAWQTPKTQLQAIKEAMQATETAIMYTDASKSGYVDVAMLNETFGCPCYCIGAIGGNSHGVGEWVDISSLDKLLNILTNLI